MSQVITPPPTTTLTATTPAATIALAPVEVAVTSTPPNVDQLLRQIQISGTVAAPPDNSGTVTLATALGNFSFSVAQVPENIKQQLVQQLDALFQSGKPVTATVQAGAPPTEAVLLLPTPSGTTAQPASAAPPTQTPLPPVSFAVPTLTTGLTFPAVVLPPDIPLPQQTPQPLPPKDAAQTPPPPPTSGNVTTASNPQPAIPVPSAPATAQQTAPLPTSPLIPLLQAGNEITVHVDAVVLPNANTPLPAPTAPNQIAATVIGNGANGQLIVKAGDATLYVRAPVEAPIGTNLLISVEAQKPAPPTLLQAADPPNFAALQQVLESLAQTNPQLAQQIFNTHIPQPNQQLAGTLLFFLSALKQGDAKNWLGGNAVETLTRAGKMGLLAQLARNLDAAPQTTRDPAVGEWKSYPVPIHYDGQFQPLMFHVHADGRHNSPDALQKNAPNQTRFLIDVRMSRFGPLQLDGLVRPQKLDMIIRSESALPSGLPQELRTSYLRTIEALGYTGGLSFQTGRQSWIVPRQDAPQSLIT